MQKIGIDARMFSDAFTGIGRYTYELTKYFFSRNEASLKWVLFMNDPQFSQVDFSTAKVSSSQISVIKVDSPHYSMAEQLKFLRILRKEKCDLVHFPHFNVPLGYRRKFIATIHDTTLSFYPGKKMNTWWRRLAYRRVMQHACRRAVKVITVSDNTQTDVIRLFKANPNKISTIWNGIDDAFQPISGNAKKAACRKFDLSENFLFYTGVWREHKNLTRFIRAFRLILDRLACMGRRAPKNLQLVLTGKPDPHYPEVLDVITELKLEDHIKMVGMVTKEDLVQLYGAATLLVFPSLYEGFGFPPLEAMKTHTPVAASRISAIPEVCGNAVQYFDPMSIHDIEEKITGLIMDKAMQKEYIKRGEARVKLFSWKKCGEATWRIYQEALGF